MCPYSCYHKCTTFSKQSSFQKKEFVSAFYVSTLSTNEKSSHRAAAGRKWKNKFRKSVGAVVFNQTCASIYNLSMIPSEMHPSTGSWRVGKAASSSSVDFKTICSRNWYNLDTHLTNSRFIISWGKNISFTFPTDCTVLC